MYGKFKISIFIHKSVSEEKRKTEGFRAAVLFLPELYAAHLNPTPTSWKDERPGYESRPMRDEFLYTPSRSFDYAHEGFLAATRAEIHILDGAFEIEFFNGKESTGHKIVFSLHDEDFGAGFTGGARIR